MTNQYKDDKDAVKLTVKSKKMFLELKLADKKILKLFDFSDYLESKETKKKVNKRDVFSIESALKINYNKEL